MPKELKKRGRRGEEKKRKRDPNAQESESKRPKQTDTYDENEAQHVAQFEFAGGEEGFNGEDAPRPDAMPFFGMLDEDEQEYFKKADELLELNQFDGPEDRAVFLESVYREAEGKELKIANSQSCSRLMERLILLSTPAQLKNLFKKFSSQ